MLTVGTSAQTGMQETAVSDRESEHPDTTTPSKGARTANFNLTAPH